MSRSEGHYNKQERSGDADRGSIWDSLRRTHSDDRAPDENIYTSTSSQQETQPTPYEEKPPLRHDDADAQAEKEAKAKETHGITMMMLKLLFIIIVYYTCTYLFLHILYYNRKEQLANLQKELNSEMAIRQKSIRQEEKAHAIALKRIGEQEETAAKKGTSSQRESEKNNGAANSSPASKQRSASPNQIRYIRYHIYGQDGNIIHNPDIKNEAYMDCRKLHTVEISCKSIGKDAFRGCYALEKVLITGSLTTIRSGAFAECFSLTTLLLPKSLTKIEDNILEGTRNIREISMPYNVRTQFADKFGNIDAINTLYILTDVFFKMPSNLTDKGLSRRNCTLYVPDALYMDFLKDPDWILFDRIEPLSKSQYYDAKCRWKY